MYNFSVNITQVMTLIYLVKGLVIIELSND